jgi:hypothetical protein
MGTKCLPAVTKDACSISAARSAGRWFGAAMPTFAHWGPVRICGPKIIELTDAELLKKALWQTVSLGRRAAPAFLDEPAE